MSPAGFWFQQEKGVSSERLQDFVKCDGFFADLGSYRVFFPYAWVNTEGSFYAVSRQLRGAVNYCEIGFFNGSLFELSGDFPLCDVVSGSHDNAACVSVESVDDSGSEFTEAAGKGGAVKGESVNESAVSISACGMDNHIRLFVDDDNIMVLVDDVDGYIFCEDVRWRRWRERKLYFVGGGETETGFDGAAVDFYMARRYVSLESDTAEMAEAVVEVFVESAFLDSVADVQDHRFGGGWWNLGG